MKLKNSKGVERNFQIVLEVVKSKKTYVIYKDPISNYLYGGRKVRNKLKPLTDKELDFLDKMIEKLER